MDWYIQDIIKRALQEDIGHQDITTDNLVDKEQRSRGVFLAKAAGIVAGIHVAQEVFRCLDHDIQFTVVKNDGEKIAPGDTLAVVAGRTRSLLKGERVALNFLQRLSGIATRTNHMVELIRYEKAEIVDTRKTTPGLRRLEKYAVSVGGARNHRFGLYDGALIKDNHIKAAGGIQKAISTLRTRIPHTIKIEVEVENLEQLQEALEARADIIMLDNMDIDTLHQAVEITAGQALLEASGGITEANLVEVARTGVDFISIGALTHSAGSLDISFNLE
ncbi:MAG: carboxylating nicotinate-nucleotide diphosphorylase [Syntrophomonadaceae bacterium]|jgi:nicotinate-nucleotide pyrophosphorylase (carboxylating)|nr:carboxylating nicotinate-nucleotide diphosphorylase [Bacillota bacterium]NLM87716.1 carboxylating nicotinate-nucleotide diphosphorylase [Syntrophomonadaceae bacterium]HQA49299.1 carboxylating nicotinate-nucleotide diphosphorylase [Syntrophomonadaceae bacterium]